MIPILYDKTETSFVSNGLGRLASCIRCVVTEERNGIYECEFDFPISDPKYELIQEGQIIAVTHDDNGDIQPFDIYHRTAPIDGIVTFFARHISYRQIGITVEPFTASGVANAIAGIKTNSYGSNPFTYATDKTTAGTYTVTVPSSARALLGGEENSLLDVFGAGEYEFDKFDVHLWTRRGADTDVEIRYRKNLTDIEHDVDYTESYNGVAPYWYGLAPDPADPDTEIETLVMLPEVAVMASGQTYDGRDTVLPLDLSDEFDEKPTVNALRTLATQKLNEADTLKPIENITVSFVQLWQTDEYADVAPLQKVGLCDTVSVIYPELGIDRTTVKVIKTVYNTLLDRYDEMELGDSLSSYAAIITANNTSAISQLEDGLLIVSMAAEQAANDAFTAKRAATSAQADAGDALIAAGNAVTQAGNAANAAAAAQSSADAAQASADAAALQSSTANAYANSALDQLGIVQSVVGVLDLLSTNATYQRTTDTEIVPGKWYFTYDGTSYSVVTNPTAIQYELTSDVTIDPDKTYYTRSGSGTEEDPYVYTPVENPDVSEIGTYYECIYYEMVDIDAAVQDYVTSRLVVTGDGLWVQDPSMQTKVLLSGDDGVILYGPDGTIIGKYGATAQIGDAAGFHIEMDGTELGFYQADRKVAYISNNQLYITQSVVLQQMDLGIPVNDGGLGQWSWKVHANGETPSRNNLNLKWIG